MAEPDIFSDAFDEMAEIEFDARAKADARDLGLRALADFIRPVRGKEAIAFAAFCVAFAGYGPGHRKRDPGEIQRVFLLHEPIRRGMAIQALRNRIDSEPDKTLKKEMFLLLETLTAIDTKRKK